MQKNDVLVFNNEYQKRFKQMSNKKGLSKLVSILKKKIGLTAVIALMMIGTSLATWVLSVDTSITGNVVSTEGGTVMITQDFTDFGVMDTTNSSMSVNQTATITNGDGDLNFVVTITDNRTDVVDGCTDYENDIVTVVELNDVVITNGQNVTINSGDNYLRTTATAELASCPQEFGTAISMVAI